MKIARRVEAAAQLRDGGERSAPALMFLAAPRPSSLQVWPLQGHGGCISSCAHALALSLSSPSLLLACAPTPAPLSTADSLTAVHAPVAASSLAQAPDYETLAGAFSPSDPVVIASVDADAQKELAARFEIKGFPTLKWFPAGSDVAEAYDGGRSLDEMLTLVNGKTGLSKHIAKPVSAVLEADDGNFDAVLMGTELHKFRFVRTTAAATAAQALRAQESRSGRLLGLRALSLVW